MNDELQELMQRYTEIRRCVVAGVPEARTVWLTVDGQQFCVTPLAMDSLDEAEHMQQMLARALLTILKGRP